MVAKNKHLMFKTEEEKHGVPYLYLCDKNDKCRRMDLNTYPRDHTFLKDGLVNIFTNTVMITGEHKDKPMKRTPTPYPLKKPEKKDKNQKVNKTQKVKTQKMNIQLKKPKPNRSKTRRK